MTIAAGEEVKHAQHQVTLQKAPRARGFMPLGSIDSQHTLSSVHLISP